MNGAWPKHSSPSSSANASPERWPDEQPPVTHGIPDSPLHLVSAWASRQRLEITAIRYWERLELKGALVTIDAMGCQTKIAQKILGSRGRLSARRGGELAGPVRRDRHYFADTEPDIFARCETTGGEHGRIESAVMPSATTSPGWRPTGASQESRASPASAPSPWSKASSSATADQPGATLLSLLARIDPRAFAAAVRCHWHVGKPPPLGSRRFHDDLCRLRQPSNRRTSPPSDT